MKVFQVNLTRIWLLRSIMMLGISQSIYWLTFRLSRIKGPQTLRKEAKSSKFRVSKTKESLLV